MLLYNSIYICGIEDFESLTEKKSFCDDELDLENESDVLKPNLVTNVFDKAYNSKVLKYVQGNNDLDPQLQAIPAFCFPSGLKIDTKQNDIIFHSFVLTQENGDKSYWSCLTYPTLLNNINYNELSRKKTDSVASASSFDEKKDQLYVPQCICLCSYLPFIAETKQVLLSLYEISQKGSDHSLDAYVSALFYREAQSTPNSITTLKFPEEILFHQTTQEELPLYTFNLISVFQMVRPKLFIDLVFSCLTDKQIYVQSSNIENLTLFMESLLVCIFPFRWCHSYVPVLPESMLYFLEAPVPFLMGVSTEGMDQPPDLMSEAIMVDLDKGEIIPLNDRNDTVPAVIEKKETIPEIIDLENNIISLLPVNDDGDIVIDEQSPKITHEIRLAFVNTLATFLAGYNDYIMDDDMDEDDKPIDDGSLLFDTLAFISEFPSAHCSFLAEFTQSQAFASFLDLKKDVERKLADPLTVKTVHYFDNLVNQNAKQKTLELKLKLSLSHTANKAVQIQPKKPKQAKVGPLTSAQFQQFPKNTPKPFLAVDFDLLQQIAEISVKFTSLQKAGVKRSSSRYSKGISVHGVVSRRSVRASVLEPDLVSHTEVSESVMQNLEFLVSRLCVSYRNRLNNLTEWKDIRTKKDSGQTSSPLKTATTTFMQAQPKGREDQVLELSKKDISQTKIFHTEVAALSALLESVFSHGSIAPKNKAALGKFIFQSNISELTETYEDRERIKNNLAEVKTPVGQARAFVKLSIEKGLLAAHLGVLLKDKDLLEKTYKKYAMLADEKVIEKMTGILQKLVACDYPCYSDREFAKELSATYKVHFTTGDSWSAGTTATVMILLIGQNGRKSQRITLPRTSQSFHRGETSTFEIKAHWLGPLASVIVGHDNSGNFPGWELSNVVIEHVATGILYYFPCSQWFAIDEGDKQIIRNLSSVTCNIKNRKKEIVGVIPRRMTAAQIDSLGIVKIKLSKIANLATIEKKRLSMQSVGSASETDEDATIKKTTTIQSIPEETQNAPVPTPPAPVIVSSSVVERTGPKSLAEEYVEGLGVAIDRIMNYYGITAEDQRIEAKNLQLVKEISLNISLCFGLGFISKRGLFRADVNLWDFVLDLRPNQNSLDPELLDEIDEFLRTVGTISRIKGNYTNQKKFEWLTCVALQKQKFYHWFAIIFNDTCIEKYYDKRSVLRDEEQKDLFLLQCEKLRSFPIKIPPSMIAEVMKMFV